MIRSWTAADLPAVLLLNNAHAAEVNALSAEALAALVGVAAVALVVDGGLGFLIALDERTPAQGPNHAWFLARRPSFVYIDRVVVAPEARGQGWARAASTTRSPRAPARGRSAARSTSRRPTRRAS
ncbi:MAG TPA: hypothetical protein VF334_10775, partial [Polyangia bacterium]